MPGFTEIFNTDIDPGIMADLDEFGTVISTRRHTLTEARATYVNKFLGLPDRDLQ